MGLLIESKFAAKNVLKLTGGRRAGDKLPEEGAEALAGLGGKL